ncbi:bifunctional YncE family protein/alkaline phosphatase family protein [Paenibacillus filicis]|uniref:Bifunctional YncE family protein/alkaline phosphatase family protein n=1 Tax=Paenibacillus gyeongsangnamensis TaxID=3388067 RepID=A0ABT4QA19_9BACL|nr:bifunctional YncE family protein/alkaline phosphatase family protein [Paenibacillus filicis]MCZ8513735.1 bifunctional YncE family protein/alkaline phosphatase family protein [Paenibacillus filicis]
MSKNKKMKKLITGIVVASAIVGSGSALASSLLTAGPQGDGTAYTPAGWRVTPAGTQKPAGFFPANAVLSPDGSAVLVPNIIKDASSKQTVHVMDAKDGSLIQVVELDKKAGQGAAAGLAFSHDGGHVYLATANMDTVVVFGWDNNARKLTIQQTLALPKGTYPQGVAVSPDDKTIYVTGQYARTLVAVDVASGKTALAAAGAYPFGVVLSTDGHTAYVSNQGENTISVFSVDGLTVTPKSTITVGTHPNNMLMDAKGHCMFVANGDNDTITEIDTTSNAVKRTISVAPFEGAHAGSQPTNLAMSPDGRTLYVTNGGNNDVAVIDLTGEGESEQSGRVKGLVPTGWYPTGVQVTPDGQRLLITSAKGLGTGPNKGTDPSKPNSYPYIESQLQGYLSVVPTPNENQLEKYTDQVRKNNGFEQKNKVRGFNDGTPGTIVPRRVGEDSPIKHVIYIVKENRTYDQVLGDLKNPDGSKRGNGDPTLTLFGQDITPNQHKLAQQFVTLDNFYVNGEVSQNGWQWVTQASSNPYNETATVQGYAGNGSEYDSEGYSPNVAAGSADPSRAYLWDKLAQHNISFRNYGQFVVPSDWIKPGEMQTEPGKYYAHDPILNASTNHDYPWFDMGISDQTRFDIWNKDFQSYVANNNLPAMQFIDLPRDHTAGAKTAKELVADNDLALGKIVDTVSHSKYWKDTAIFVVEDDAQSGPDHVDAHRTIAQVISPYTQIGKVDSHFYSQVSMLRTMELFLGIEPMSQFDAAALPMIWSFADKPNFTPYQVLTPGQAMNPTVQSSTYAPTTAAPANTPAPSSAQPVIQPGRPDQGDSDQLNEELWKEIKGPGVPMPKPKHSVFGDENDGQDANKMTHWSW